MKNTINKIQGQFGDLKPRHENVHGFLGMKRTRTDEKKIEIYMTNQINKITEASQRIAATVSTPAARYLMTVNPNAK